MRSKALAIAATFTAAIGLGLPSAGAGVKTSFGTGGRVVEGSNEVQAAVRPNRNIVGVSAVNPGPGDTAQFFEHDQAGAPAGLGGSGTASIAAPAGVDLWSPAGVVLLGNGTTVAQFVSNNPGGLGATLFALKADGTPDTSFGGGDGVVSETFPSCGWVTDLDVLPDGSLASVAHELDTTVPGGGPNPCRGTTLRKYTAAGARVTTFGNASAATDNAHRVADLFAIGLAVDAGGNIHASGVADVLVGEAHVNFAAVLKVDGSGAPVAGFGSSGLATFEPSPGVNFEYIGVNGGPHRIYENKVANDIAIDGSGRAVVAGASQRTNGGKYQAWTARLTTAGALDAGYGTGGIGVLDATPGSDALTTSVGIDGDGRVVVSGSSCVLERPAGGGTRCTLNAGATAVAPRSQFTARFGANGTPDAGFAPVVTQFGQATQDHMARWQRVDGDRIVVSGSVTSTFQGYIGVVENLGSTPPPPPSTKSGWMVPTRVMDTREGLGGPTLGPSTVRTLDLSSSGVPADAIAVALNITATRATVNSFVAVYPTSSARPDVSALNTVEGLDVSNGIVVGLGPNRRIDLYNHDGSVDLVVDVMGWFGPAGVNKITPARVLDTRSTGGPMAAGGTRVVQVTGGAVPAGAKAVAVNVTAVAPSEDTYVTAWPGVGPKPDASAVNAVGGRTVANAMVLGLDNAGRMSLYNHAGATDVLVDVLGWFDAGGFNAIEPTRRMDTREGLGGVVLGPGEARSLDVLPAGVTAGQVAAVSLNITATESSVPSFLSIWPSDGSQPNASVVNMEAGQTVANAHLVDVGADGKIVIFNNTGSSHVVVDITGWVPVG